MNIQLLENLNIIAYGISGIAANNDYTGTAFKLSDKMWRIVKENGIKNKGKNIWIYGADENVFAGVELIEPPVQETELERKIIHLPKYACYKHTGPYNLIKRLGQEMTQTLTNQGYQIIEPYIEIYGHWTGNDSTTETDLLMALK